MNRVSNIRRWSLVCTIAVLSALGAACDTAPPAPRPVPESRPVKPAPATSQPATSQPAIQPATPELPEYLEVLRRFDTDRPARVQVLDTAERRLVLDTHNVRRIRIDRATAPVRPDRSVALILDGQGIEWVANSKTTLFERTRNGEWLPVPPEDE